VEKYRELQISIDFSLPHHLLMVQKLFGIAVGLGCWRLIPCTLKQCGVSARVVTTQQMNLFSTSFLCPMMPKCCNHCVVRLPSLVLEEIEITPAGQKNTEMPGTNHMYVVSNAIISI